jgi:penicillin-binding protein 1A
VVQRIVDSRGEMLFEAAPEVAGKDAERVLDPRNAFLMASLMRDVVKVGTAARAMSLGRQDLAGKTGTTNDHIDAWFAGFHPTLVAVSWIGFDTPAPLGANETGGQAALPMWMSYMARALKGVAEVPLEPPPGIVTAYINPVTGMLEPDGRSKLGEFFFAESLPQAGDEATAARDAGRPTEDVRNQIF